MRFVLIPVVLLFGFSSAEAKTEMVLFVSNHWGFRKQEKITVETPQKVFYNDILIPKEVLLKVKQKIVTLRKMPKVKWKFCHENQYNYRLSSDSDKQEVHACAEGEEFARIAGAFSGIQQAILKNGK